MPNFDIKWNTRRSKVISIDVDLEQSGWFWVADVPRQPKAVHESAWYRVWHVNMTCPDPDESEGVFPRVIFYRLYQHVARGVLRTMAARDRLRIDWDRNSKLGIR